MHISKSKRCFNVKSPTYYFHIKTNGMANFQICISVPLSFKRCGKQYTDKTVDSFRTRWNNYKTDGKKAGKGNIGSFKQQFLQSHFLEDYRHGFLKDAEVILTVNKKLSQALREKCLYSELFWSVFSRIWTEYGKIRSTSTYSVRMRENTNQNNPEYEYFL